MAAMYRKEEQVRLGEMAVQEEAAGRPLHQTVLFMATLVLILIAATLGEGTGFWHTVYAVKWWLTVLFGLALALELVLFYRLSTTRLLLVGASTAVAALVFPGPEMPFVTAVAGLSLVLYFQEGEAREWFESSYILARQILPVLFAGVFFAGFLLGRPDGSEGIISSAFVAELVGGNSIFANFFASLVGALMYFATLTEVPILQGLMNAGMGHGPALALLLAGPAVSLPNMLVIRTVMGTEKTAAYAALVTVFATVTGLIFGGIYR